jgi:DNA-directed RNA polymerase specialized sigma24 family protein
MSSNSETLTTPMGLSNGVRITPDRSSRRRAEVRAEDRMWAAQMRARHGDLILRYASRRVPSPEQAEQVSQAVFASAAANRPQIAEPALPWLIAAARAECAASRAQMARRTARRAS